MREIIILSLCLISCSLFAQQERKYVRDGNQSYKDGKLNDAEEQYDKALTKNNKSPEANYDLGSVYLKRDSLEKAAHQFNTAAELATDPKVKSKAYYNEGNSYLQGKKFNEAVASYKNALKNDPKDEDTRYNLAYAERLLKQDQQKKKNDKNKDNKDQKDQNQKDQQSGKNDKGQDKKDQDNKNGQQNKDSQEKKDGQNKDQQAQKGDEKDEKGQPGKVKAGMSKEQAEKLLEALRNEEQKVQLKLAEKKAKPVNKKIDKDW